MRTGISWDGWHGLAAGALSTRSKQQLHRPYDSTDSLDYLVCLETLPWERCGWLPPRVVAEHVEWVLATPLNAMPPAWLERTGAAASSAYTYQTAPRVVAEHVEWVLATPPAWLERTGAAASSAYTY